MITTLFTKKKKIIMKYSEILKVKDSFHFPIIEHIICIDGLEYTLLIEFVKVLHNITFNRIKCISTLNDYISYFEDILFIFIFLIKNNSWSRINFEIILNDIKEK